MLNYSEQIKKNLQEDIQKGFEQKIMVAGNVRWVVLPNEDWARRSSGLLANRLHQMHPENAHLVMIEKPESYVVSIRRPQNHSNSSALIANIFHTGGGRAEAAGINSLKKSNLSFDLFINLGDIIVFSTSEELQLLR